MLDSLTSSVVAFKLCSLVGIGLITVLSALLPIKYYGSGGGSGTGKTGTDAEDDPQRRVRQYSALPLFSCTLVHLSDLFFFRPPKQQQKQDRILSYFSFFTGGVFLGAGLLHLLPDSVELNPYAHFTDFPFVYLLCASGFVTVWSVEKLKLGGSIQTPVQNEKMVAITTAAASGDGGSGGEQSGGSICYVRVEPVTTYNRGSTNFASSNGGGGGGHSHAHSHGGGECDDHHSDEADGGGGDERTPLQPSSKGAAAAAAAAPVLTAESALLGSGGSAFGGSGGGGGAASYDGRRPSRSQHSCGAAHSHADDSSRSHSGLHEDVCVGAPIYEHHSYQSSSSGLSSHTSARRSTAAGGESNVPVAAASGGGHSSVAGTPPVINTGGHGSLHDHRHDSVHHHHIVIPAHSGLWLPLLLALIFSIHSLIEGLALGVATKVDNTALSVLVAIVAHKSVEAVTVSTNFVRERVNVTKALPVILVYCMMTPLGIALGMLMNSVAGEQTLAVECVLQAVASGSFIYLAIHEVSEERACHVVKSTHQVALVVIGLAFMSIIAIWA